MKLFRHIFFFFRIMNSKIFAKSNKVNSLISLIVLTLNVPILDKVKKLSYIFIFTLLCGAPKGFMKAFKAFKNLT